MVAEAAQYSGYLEYKKRGAPLTFVIPPSGLPANPDFSGIVDQAPHPEAAKLFLDWYLSPLGQTAIENALFQNSPRTDVPPPPGGVSVAEMPLKFPKDWKDYTATGRAFTREWNAVLGIQ